MTMSLLVPEPIVMSYGKRGQIKSLGAFPVPLLFKKAKVVSSPQLLHEIFDLSLIPPQWGQGNVCIRSIGFNPPEL